MRRWSAAWAFGAACVVLGACSAGTGEETGKPPGDGETLPEVLTATPSPATFLDQLTLVGMDFAKSAGNRVRLTREDGTILEREMGSGDGTHLYLNLAPSGSVNDVDYPTLAIPRPYTELSNVTLTVDVEATIAGVTKNGSTTFDYQPSAVLRRYWPGPTDPNVTFEPRTVFFRPGPVLSATGDEPTGTLYGFVDEADGPKFYRLDDNTAPPGEARTLLAEFPGYFSAQAAVVDGNDLYVVLKAVVGLQALARISLETFEYDFPVAKGDALGLEVTGLALLDGKLYFLDWMQGRVGRVDPGTGEVVILAGESGTGDVDGDGTVARFQMTGATGMTAHAGALWFVANDRLRRVTPGDDAATTVVDGDRALVGARDVAFDPAGNLWVGTPDGLAIVPDDGEPELLDGYDTGGSHLALPVPVAPVAFDARGVAYIVQPGSILRFARE